MWFNVIFIVILFLVAFIGFTGYSFAKDNIKENNSAFEQLSRIELSGQLEQLPEMPGYYREPDAMCYSSAPPLDRVQYLCPVCGEMTVYKSSSYNGEIDNLQRYRLLVNKITKIDVKLDESQFCKKCTPWKSSRQYCLLVKYGENKKVHKTYDFTQEDIILLYEYSEGMKEHNWFDKRPITEYKKRLEELLGTKIEL